VPALTADSPCDGVLVLQSELWATNSVLVSGRRDCLVCDPSIFPDEVQEIRGHTRSFERVFLLITHSDHDHTCGIGAFAGATVLAGARTAQAIGDGTAGRKLAEAERLWDIAWPGEPRVDAIVAGESRWGEFELVTIDVHGHAGDGSAFVIPGRGLLLPGDYLSAACYPYLLDSLADTITAYERLLAAVEEYDVEMVVPGHGPCLDRARARLVATEDLEYLHSLQGAARDAVLGGGSAGSATIAAFAVEPPRPARADFEAFGMRSANARRAVAEQLSASLPA
jgi:hydroxyacylglutathione hydrolase